MLIDGSKYPSKWRKKMLTLSQSWHLIPNLLPTRTTQNKLRFPHSRAQRQDIVYDKPYSYECVSADTREKMNLLFFFKEVKATAVAGWPVVKVDTAVHFPPFRFQIFTCITHTDEILEEQHKQSIPSCRVTLLRIHLLQSPIRNPRWCGHEPYQQQLEYSLNQVLWIL